MATCNRTQGAAAAMGIASMKCRESSPSRSPCLRSPIPRRRQSHKVFVGGLPQNVTEGELLHYFEKEAGPVADVLILKVRRSPLGLR